MHTTAAMPQLRAGRREWTGLAVLALPTLLLALDFSVLFLALPKLGADLHPSSTQLLWITDIYGFMVAGFLVTMGTLGDRIGRRKLLMVGASVFGAVSVLAAYSVSAEMLIAARALLGIAGATLMPSTLALITNMFRDPAQRATAISLWVTCLLGGVAVGPLIGGALLGSFWWGSVFLLGVPVMALLLLTAPSLLPEYRDPTAGRLDLVSVGLSLATILPVVYGLKELARGGLAAGPVLAMAAGAAVAVVFVLRQRRLADPLLDVMLFRDRAVAAALVILMVGAGTVIGVGFVFAQYLQLVVGLSPLAAGLWSVPDALALIVGSLLAPAAARRAGPAVTVGAGLMISSFGFLLLTQVQPSSLGLAVTGITIVSFGLAPTLVLGTDLVVGSVAPQRAGSAAALSETSSELGIALGVAILGSISTLVYRQRVGAAAPRELAADVSAAARDTIVEATSAAARLPGEVGTALLSAARDAYATAFSVVAAVSVPVMIALAVLAMIRLRQVLLGGDSAAEENPPPVPVDAPAPADDQQWLPPGTVLARDRDFVLLSDVAAGRGQRVGALLDALTDTTAARLGGRDLSRRLALLVGEDEPGAYPAWCAVGPAADGLVVMVHGPAEAVVAVGGQEVRLDGREAATVVDRVVAGRVESIRATVGEAGIQVALPPLPEVSRVPAMPAWPPDPDAAATVEAPLRWPHAGDELVTGRHCQRGHFNDPAVQYCTQCGVSMVSADRALTVGARPPLGVLVLDDGTVYPLVRDHVIGRAPEADRAVAATGAYPLRLLDSLVSRVHARVVLDGWAAMVVDAGSSNGTFVCLPGESTWSRLPRGGGTLLRPGTQVAVGSHQLRYHSHRNR
jgi:MFS transporter, DHA2 family, multidrug resistance protein